MRRLFRPRGTQSAPSSPRQPSSPRPSPILRSRSEGVPGPKEERRVSDLGFRMEKALESEDWETLRGFLQNPEIGRSLVLYRFMEVLARRIGDEKLHPKVRTEATEYFATYATEMEPDDVLALVVTHLETTQVLGYISYCTREGWSRVMRAALQRQEPVIIRYIWDVPERPRGHALRKILLSYIEEVQDKDLSSSPEKHRIPRTSLRYLLHLVHEKEGHILVLLREDTEKREGPQILDLLENSE